MIFKLKVRVLPDDIDEQDHVNNLVYLRWVQEIATAHWRAVASAVDQEVVSWVVLRHEIDYKAPALLGDEVDLTTWVGKATRLTFERFTEIRRANGGELLSTARTLWCPVDPGSGRPTRVSADVRTRFST
jgi:acyl-CoA thioester hydrolase